MTVRIFIPWFLPAYKAGGPVQTITNLVSLQEQGIRYKIVCSNKDLNRTTINIKNDTWLSWNGWTDVFYSSHGTGKALMGAKDETLLIIGIYSWQFNLKPILFSKAHRKIVSVRGMLHAGALSQKAFKKKLFLALWKLAGLHRKVEFHASDETEEEAIRDLFGKKVKVHQAANLPRIFVPQPVREKRRGELRLVSVALVSPMKNILLVLQGLQRVDEKVDYHIFGPIKDKGYWKQCQDLIATLPTNITVCYHGDVHPSRVEEVFQEGQVFILPSKSENFGHALYEALTAGKPVITSHHTPWNRLESARAGLNVSVQSEEAITDAVRFFAAMDITELQAWSRGARAYAEAAIDVEAIKEQYREMFGLKSNQQQLVAVEQKQDGK